MTPLDAAALLVVAALAWTSAAGGGTSAADLVLVVVALIAALALAATRAPVRAGSTRTAAVVVALELWLLVTATGPSGVWSVETVRVPVLVLIVALTVHTVRRLGSEQRELIAGSLIVIGSVHGVAAVVEAVRQVASAGPVRVDGLLGNPNALGMLLVATGSATLREIARGPSRPARLALVVQCAALLLTGSRWALLVCLLLVVPCAARGASRRVVAVTGLWSAVALTIAVHRLIVGGWDRLGLWRAALPEIAARPLAGRGAEPRLIDVPGWPVRPTTHVHNEVLQLAVEHGLVAVALVMVIAGLVVAALADRPRDKWLTVAAVALLSSGLTDFGLRITAIALMAAAVGALALVPPGEGAGGALHPGLTHRGTARVALDDPGRTGLARRSCSRRSPVHCSGLSAAHRAQ
jgi:hypothetical protein